MEKNDYKSFNEFWKKEKHNIVVLFVIMIFVLILAYIGRKYVSLYPETGQITDIQETENGYLLEFTLSNGNMFLYEAEDGDCEIGDFYSLLMDSNYTNNTVKDDKIKEIKYCNF